RVISEKEVVNPPKEEEIKKVLHSFEGKITQIPPMYSAVKVNGKKLYEYARTNEEVERRKREVTIHEIKQRSSNKNNNLIINMKEVRSIGTDNVTVSADIGKALDSPTHMYSLVRRATGSLDKKDTYTFDTIEDAVTQNKHNELLLPILKGLSHLDKLSVNQESKWKVLNGQKLAKPEHITSKEPFTVVYHEQLLAIYQIHHEHSDEIKPVRVFNS